MKLKVPINLKILFVTISALVVACGLLIKQSMELQSQDKMSHAYQTQLNETELLSDKFQSLLHSSVNSLKQIGSLDWTQNLNNQDQVLTILKNQKELTRMFVVEVPLVSEGSPRLLFKSSNAYGDVEQGQVFDKVISQIELLVKEKPVVVNLTTNQEAQVGIMIPDIQFLSQGKIIVFVGLVDTQNLFSGVDYDVEVVSKNGDVIYASDLKVLLTKTFSSPTLMTKAWQSQVNSSIMELEQNQIKLLGSYAKMDFDLLFVATRPLIKVVSSVYVTSQKMILMGIMALCAALYLATRLSTSITKPIKNLTEAVEKIAKGNFKVKINNKSNDEIGSLATAFELMSDKISNLLVSQEEKIRLENEMNIAATVQKTLFPKTVVSLDHVEMVSHYTPASECGGDLWSYFTSQNKIYFIIADATGHGLPSALITVSTKSTLSLVKRMLDQNLNLTLAEILAYANRSVFETSQGKIMMTCFIGCLDLTTGELTYSNAGHNPPWVFSGDKISSLAIPGTRLGESLEQVEYKTKTLMIKPGDKIFLYTDGIVENTNLKGEMFDKKRVRELVKSNLSQGIQPTLNKLLQEFKKFVGTKKHLDDDTTVVIMEIKKLGPVSGEAA